MHGLLLEFHPLTQATRSYLLLCNDDSTLRLNRLLMQKLFGPTFNYVTHCE